MDAAEFHPSEVPAKPGVYVFRDRFGEVIYVGKARRLRRRLANYFQPSRRRTADPKTRSLINSIAEWNYELVRSEDEALILESRLIKDYAPRYNVLMRDRRYRDAEVRVFMHPDVLARLRNEDAELLNELEEKYGQELSFRADPALHYEEFRIVDRVTGTELR